MSDPVGGWERVAAELRACKESQQRAWGDVDNATLGRYLAGELSAAEQHDLEQTLETLPELRKLTDLVQDVLRDLAPVEESEPERVVVPAPAAVVLPFEPRRPRRRAASWLHRYAPLAAAACLLLALGLLMPRPGFLSAPRPDAPVAENALAMGRGANGGLGPDAPMIFLTLPPTPEKEKVAEPAPLPAPHREPAAPPRAVVRAVPQTPQELSRAVTFYHAQGDVARAEQTLRAAHGLCQKKLGPRHDATRWTARQLAGVYQVALNTTDAPTPEVIVRGGGGRRDVYADRAVNPYARARRTALTVRRELTTRPAREVVPVLAQALRSTTCPRERQALVRALGELGPAARQAVPALAERLRQATDPAEQRAILRTLNQIGPAAGDAATVLASLSSDERPARFMTPHASAARGRKYAEPCCKLSAHEAKLARQVLARMSSEEARVGVFDGAGLFSVRGIIDTTRALRHEYRRDRVAVRVETLGKGDRPAGTPLAAMGPRAVHVVLGPDGGVRVHVSAPLRSEGLDPETLGARLAEVSRKQPDQALAVVLGRVKGLGKGGKK